MSTIPRPGTASIIDELVEIVAGQFRDRSHHIELSNETRRLLELKFTMALRGAGASFREWCDQNEATEDERVKLKRYLVFLRLEKSLIDA
jgi:hypothetical protein